MPPVTSQISVCWCHTVLYNVAATVTFQRLFCYVEVAINLLSCFGAVPFLGTVAVHGCIVGGANACPAGIERTPLIEHQLYLRVENFPLPTLFKVSVTEDKPLFIPLFV